MYSGRRVSNSSAFVRAYLYRHVVRVDATLRPSERATLGFAGERKSRWLAMKCRRGSAANCTNGLRLRFAEQSACRARRLPAGGFFRQPVAPSARRCFSVRCVRGESVFRCARFRRGHRVLQYRDARSQGVSDLHPAMRTLARTCGNEGWCDSAYIAPGHRLRTRRRPGGVHRR